MVRWWSRCDSASLPFLFQDARPLVQFRLDGLDGRAAPRLGRHEVRLRIDRQALVAREHLAGQRVERRQPVDLVAEQLDAQADVLVGRVDLDDVAAGPEGAAVEVVVVALVLDLDQLAQERLAADGLAALEREQHAVVGLGRAQAVDARDAGDDDDVAPLEQRSRRRQPHPVDLVVDGGFLLDVRVGRRDVGLGLVEIVVADEVLDRVVREEPPELLVELGGQRLVVRHDQRRAVHPGDGLGHREGLARPGDAEQHLVLIAALEPVDELVDGARLVAGEVEIRDEREAVVDRGHAG